MVLLVTVRGPPPCAGLKEFSPWLTDTDHEADEGPPFLPMPKNASAPVLWNVYLPGPRPPPAATAAAAIARDPQKTIEMTSARRLTNMFENSVRCAVPPSRARAMAWLDAAVNHLLQPNF